MPKIDKVVEVLASSALISLCMREPFHMMSKRYYTWTCGRMLALVGAVFAIFIGFGPSASAQADTYRLHQDDVVLISLYGDPSMDGETVVGEDGNISVRLLGTVKAEGKTLDELGREIEQRLVAGEYYVKPKVSVSLRALHRPKVAVLGMVNRPGVFEFKQGERVLDALSYAGHTIPDRANIRQAAITRKSSPNESLPLDLNAVFNRGDLSQNYELEDGDTIFVPEDTQNRVFVLGAVQRPGQFPWRENMNVLDAISLAQGERAEAKMSAVSLVRRDAKSNKIYRYKLDIVKLTSDGRLANNIPILPGDLINVPTAKKVNANDIYQYLSVVYLLRNTIFNETFFRP